MTMTTNTPARTTRRLLAGLALLAAMACAAAADTPQFRITALVPTTPGLAFEGTALNARGLVAGTLRGNDLGQGAAVWSPDGTIRRLGTLPGGGGQSFATGINDTGMVVGTSGVVRERRAFAWTREGGMVDLNALLPAGMHSRAASVDNAGQVSIQASGNGLVAGYSWTAATGVVRMLPTVDGAYAKPSGMNQLGQVTGYSGTPTGIEAMLWSPEAGMVTLGRPQGWYDGTQGAAINDAGVIVGTSTVGCCINAVMWSPASGWRAMGYVPNFTGFSAAWAINNAGVVVGDSATGRDAHDIAAIWFPDHDPIDLNKLVDPADPLAEAVLLQSAIGINDAGVILAHGTLHGAATSFLLTPEPCDQSAVLPISWFASISKARTIAE